MSNCQNFLWLHYDPSEKKVGKVSLNEIRIPPIDNMSLDRDLPDFEAKVQLELQEFYVDDSTRFVKNILRRIKPKEAFLNFLEQSQLCGSLKFEADYLKYLTDILACI